MTFVAVLLGGIVGTALRLLTDAALPHADDAFPVSTLVVNLVGSFVLGALVGRVWPTAPEWLRAGLGAGLLGSFTTFSALVVSLATLTTAGFGLLAAVYLVVSVCGGVGFAALGLRLATRATPAIGVDE